MAKMTINGIEIDTQYYIDKWINKALDATPATDEEVTASIKTLYRKAGIKEPGEVIVYRDYDKFLKHNWASVWASVKDSVRASVWASVWASVGASVKDSVRASVGASVWASVRASVKDSVGASVWASVGASVGDSVSFGLYYRADDLAFAEVFMDTGVLSGEKCAELKEYMYLLSTQRLACLFENLAVILVAPTIRRDNEGRLSNDQRPAVEWENMTGQYYLDGVNLPKDIWQRIVSKKMSFSEIMKMDNADQRAVALKYNPEAIIKENGSLVHGDDRNNSLYLIEGSEINSLTNYPKMYFLRMVCPTGRVFIEAIPPKVAEEELNATACQAWACGLIKSEYLSITEEA